MKVTDREGRPVRFENASVSGGLRWRYADEEKWSDCRRAGVLLHGRPVLVTEARMGGVVVQPVTREQLSRELLHGGVDLQSAPRS